MHFHQAAHQRQADPQAALRAVERPVGLNKEIENAGEHVRRNAHASVAHVENGFLFMLFERQGDSAALAGELGGIVEEIGEHLGQTGGIAVSRDRAGGQFDGERLFSRFDQWPAGLNGARGHSGQVNGLFAQTDLAARDP